jgi:hypothetical protein
MPQLFTNNASATFASITAVDTLINVAAGKGALFPDTIDPDDYFMVSLQAVTGELEICKCISRAGDQMVVERAQEGTTAIAFGADSIIELRLTAGTLDTFMQSQAPVINYNFDLNGNSIINGYLEGVIIQATDGDPSNQIEIPTGGGDPTIGGEVIWHAGNDGTGSGLDADLLDGFDSSAFAKLAEANIFTEDNTFQGKVISEQAAGSQPNFIANLTGTLVDSEYFDLVNEIGTLIWGHVVNSGGSYLLKNAALSTVMKVFQDAQYLELAPSDITYGGVSLISAGLPTVYSTELETTINIGGTWTTVLEKTGVVITKPFGMANINGWINYWTGDADYTLKMRVMLDGLDELNTVYPVLYHNDNGSWHQLFPLAINRIIAEGTHSISVQLMASGGSGIFYRGAMDIAVHE